MTGIIGLSGYRGETGFTSTINGKPGCTGNTGVTGFTDDSGAQKGFDGERGVTGAMGRGESGSRGRVGPTGDTGPKGDQYVYSNVIKMNNNPYVNNNDTSVSMGVTGTSYITSQGDIAMEAGWIRFFQAVGVNKELPTNSGNVGSFATIGLDISGTIAASSFNTTSDYRIKENIRNITDSVNDLRPVQYFNKLTRKEEMGFLAHEVQQIFPGLVNGNKDELQYQYIDYTSLIALLTKEVQRLKSRVIKLKNT